MGLPKMGAGASVLEATRCLPADDTMALAEVRRSVTRLRLLIRQAAIVRSTPWSLQASLPPAFSNLHLPLAVPSSRIRLVGQARYGTTWTMGRALPYERAKRVARVTYCCFAMESALPHSSLYSSRTL